MSPLRGQGDGGSYYDRRVGLGIEIDPHEAI